MRDIADIFDRAVRPFLAVIFAAAYIYCMIAGLTVSEGFVAIVTAVVLWYYKSRDDEKAQQRLQDVQSNALGTGTGNSTSPPVRP